MKKLALLIVLASAGMSTADTSAPAVGVFESQKDGMIMVGGDDAADPCVVEIHAEIYDDMVDMGLETWIDACRTARQNTPQAAQ